MILKACHHQFIHHSLNLKHFCKRKHQKSEVSGHFCPTWSSEEMLFRMHMSRKWWRFVCHHFYHQWSDKSWCLLYSSVSSKSNCLEKVNCVANSQNFLFIPVLDTPHRLLCLSLPLVKRMMGCSWLFFLVICQLSHTPPSGGSHSETSYSGSGCNINSTKSPISNFFFEFEVVYS